MADSILSMLNEARTFPPTLSSDANINGMAAYQQLCARFDDDFRGTWGDLARQHLQWQTPFSRVLDDSNAPFYRWFDDGNLNVSENCLDRHVMAGLGERHAIVWEGEDGEVRRISYRALLADVCRAANGLRALGINRGDRVVIYMPMIPEAAIAMLACSRIGAIHSVVFGAFSAQALRDRLEDTGAKLVITADGGWRKGAVHALKPKVDQALGDNSDGDGLAVERVLVWVGAMTVMLIGLRIWRHSPPNVHPRCCPPNMRYSFCTRQAPRVNRRVLCILRRVICCGRG